MTSKVFLMIQFILGLAMWATLFAGGLTMEDAPFWGGMLIAQAMGLVGFLWGESV